MRKNGKLKTQRKGVNKRLQRIKLDIIKSVGICAVILGGFTLAHGFNNNNIADVTSTEETEYSVVQIQETPSAGLTKELLSIEQNDIIPVKASMGGDDVVSSNKNNKKEPTKKKKTLDEKVTSLIALNERLDFVVSEINILEKEVNAVSSKTDKLTDEQKQKLKDLSILRNQVASIKKSINKIEDGIDNIEEVSNRANMICHFNPYNVREITGADVKTLDIILEDTYLAGLGYWFYEMEQTYGINALFSIGNTALETGWGTSNKYKLRNNLYGIERNYTWPSREACIEDWFKLISRYYVGEGLTSIYTINPKYCPPNNPGWSNEIISIAYKLKNNAGITSN